MTSEEYQKIVTLYRAGRLYEANRAALKIVADERKRLNEPAPEPPPERRRNGVKAGVEVKNPELRTAQKLSAIILRETGQKIGCSTCGSGMSDLNKMPASDVLIQIEEVADRVIGKMKSPVDKTRMKAWICEAVEGA